MKTDKMQYEPSREKQPRTFSLVTLLIGLVISFTAGFLVSDAFPKEAPIPQASIDSAYSSGLEAGKQAAEEDYTSRLETQQDTLESQTEAAEKQGYQLGYQEGYDKGAAETESRIAAEAEKASAKAAKAPEAAAPTEAPPPSQTPAEAVAPQAEPQGNMVWIPTHGGKKYHSSSTCSKMKGPAHVTQEEAELEGFTPCKKCYG